MLTQLRHSALHFGIERAREPQCEKGEGGSAQKCFLLDVLKRDDRMHDDDDASTRNCAVVRPNRDSLA